MTRRDPSETVDGYGSIDRAGDRANDQHRGQTTLDFVVGISLFLAVLLFVFSFVPGMLQPFTVGTQEETVGVNRIADELSQRTLGDPAEPYVLNATCTTRFFEGAPPGDCRFGTGSIPEKLDLEFRQRVNVTITGPTAINISNPDSVRCYNKTTESLVPKSGNCNANAVVLQGGRTAEDVGRSSVSARRTVILDGKDVAITVVLW